MSLRETVETCYGCKTPLEGLNECLRTEITRLGYGDESSMIVACIECANDRSKYDTMRFTRDRCHIDARTYRDKNGNTYFTAQILLPGNVVLAHVPYEYGHGEGAIIYSAIQELKRLNKLGEDHDYQIAFRDLNFSLSVAKVGKKKDLHEGARA